MKWTFIFIALC